MKKQISAFVAAALLFGSTSLCAAVQAAPDPGNEPPREMWAGRPQSITTTLGNGGVTVVGFGGEEWYVVGYNGEGIHSEAGNQNNLTLLHKLDEAPEDGNTRYGWAPFRDYEFLEGDGQGGFPQFQEHWGKRWVLYQSGGKVIHPMMPDKTEGGTTTYKEEPNRALYYEVDADAADGEQGFTSPNDYYGGSLQQRMEEIASTCMLPLESQRLIARTLTTEDGISGKPAPDQKLWTLSTAEYKSIAKTPAENYFELFHSRTPSGTLVDILFGYNGIVIPNSLYSAHQSQVEGSDRLMPNEDLTGPVRPALNLDIDGILFTSQSTGLKSTGLADDALYEAGPFSENSSIKFTMKDDSQTLSIPQEELDARTALVDSVLTFDYTEATTGKNQYVSCVLFDEAGNLIRYGKLADASVNAAGSLSVPLKGIPAGNYTLGFFAEQANGDYYTDFAGELLEVKLSIKEPVISTVSYNGNGNTGGEAPQAHDYKTGDTVAVVGPGTLVKDGFTFTGWNTAVDGSGISYQENDSFIMADEHVILYAQWKEDAGPEEPEEPAESQTPAIPEEPADPSEPPATGDSGMPAYALLLLTGVSGTAALLMMKLRRPAGKH